MSSKFFGGIRAAIGMHKGMSKQPKGAMLGHKGGMADQAGAYARKLGASGPQREAGVPGGMKSVIQKTGDNTVESGKAGRRRAMGDHRASMRGGMPGMMGGAIGGLFNGGQWGAHGGGNEALGAMREQMQTVGQQGGGRRGGFWGRIMDSMGGMGGMRQPGGGRYPGMIEENPQGGNGNVSVQPGWAKRGPSRHYNV